MSITKPGLYKNVEAAELTQWEGKIGWHAGIEAMSPKAF